MHPQSCRQESHQRGEDCPVGPVQPGPRLGAAQHSDLVPQHEHLGLLEANDRLSRASQPQSWTKMR
jgi:hypothetical protein